MRLPRIILLLIVLVCLNSCASGYNVINPEGLNYISSNTSNDVVLNYKYDLLDKKYEKKELKKGIKLVAVKITNNSDEELIFGKSLKLIHENGNEIYVMNNEEAFVSLKQSVASYLFYLLLSPVNLYVTKSSDNGFQQETSSTPIGLILGPGLTAGNMIAAGSANKKFKTEMLDYNINGTVISKGKTVYGLVAIKTNSFDAITLKIE